MRLGKFLASTIVTLLFFCHIHASHLIHGLVDVTTGSIEFPFPENTLDHQAHTFTLRVNPKENVDTETYIQIGADGLTKKYQPLEKGSDLYYLIVEDLPNGTRRCYGYDEECRLSEICEKSTSGETLSIISWHHAEHSYTFTNAEGLTYLFETPNGILTRVETPEKGVYRYEYGINNSLSRYELPNGYFYAFNYDLHNRVSEITAPTIENSLGNTLSRFEYDPNVTKVTDALRNTVIYHHENKHITLRDDGLRSERFDWNSDNQLNSRALLDEDGRIISLYTYEYDSSGNLISETLHGHLTGVDEDNIEFYTTRYEYDELQRVVAKYCDNGTFSKYLYWENTRLVRLHQLGDAEGVKLRTVYTYDEAGRLVDTTHDDGHSIDPEDLSDVTHRIAKSTIYQDGKPILIDQKYYDLEKAEEVIKKTYMHAYNREGRLQERHILDAAGVCQQTTHYGYDIMGRIASLSGQAETVKQYRYDNIGRVTLARDSNGSLFQPNMTSLESRYSTTS